MTHELPLEPRIPVDRATPWKLVPARVLLHIFIWVGVLLRLIYWAGTGQMLDGMSRWVFAIWIITGLTAAPLILLAYIMIRWGGGKIRYVAFSIEIISNLFGGTVLSEYIISSGIAGYISYENQTVVSWVITIGVVTFFSWVILNDFLVLRGLEKRAHVLEDIENGG